MNNSTLKLLLIDYNQKRNKVIQDAENKKLELYKSFPELEKLDNDITSISIKSIQSILTSNDKVAVDKLKNELDSLKSRRTALLQKNRLFFRLFIA